MADLTIQDLCRLSHMPDNPDNPAEQIAGQKYYDVEFTGGSISNVTLTDVTINGVETERHIEVITAPGDYTVQADDYIIYVDKTVPEITTITLPASPTDSRSIIVKDATGNAGSFNITIDGNGKLIDGLSTQVLTVDYQSMEINFSTVTDEWEIIASSGDLGDVSGPGTATDRAIATYNGTTGNILRNTGVTISAANVITSPVTTGTAPLSIASTTQVANLNVARAGLADTITVVDAAADTTTFPMLAGSATGNLPVLTDPGLSYNASTNALTAGSFVGAVVGAATQVTVANEAADTTCFPLFVTAATGDLPPKSNAGLTFNSSTATLGATVFSGAGTGLTGTAASLNIGGNAATVTVADAAADTTTWVLLGTSQTGSLSPATDATLTFNASTNALTTTTFIGALTGNATTATTATNGTVSNEATDTTCFPLFVTAATGDLPFKSNASFTLNSNTGALGATSFSGAGTGLTGTAASLSIGGNAATVTVADAASDTTTFVALAGSATGSLPILTDAGLAYNASTNALTCTGAITAASIAFSSTSGIIGTTTNDSAAAGSVGELVESTVLVGSAVSLTTGTTANVTSISLTAGEWNVWGSVGFSAGGSTSITSWNAGINTTSATFPTFPGSGGYIFDAVSTAMVGTNRSFTAGQRNLKLAGTTTVYLLASSNFTISTHSAYGYISARRVR